MINSEKMQHWIKENFSLQSTPIPLTFAEGSWWSVQFLFLSFCQDFSIIPFKIIVPFVLAHFKDVKSKNIMTNHYVLTIFKNKTHSLPQKCLREILQCVGDVSPSRLRCQVVDDPVVVVLQVPDFWGNWIEHAFSIRPHPKTEHIHEQIKDVQPKLTLSTNGESKTSLEM